MVIVMSKNNKEVGKVQFDDGLIQLIVQEPIDGKQVIPLGFWDDEEISFSKEISKLLGDKGAEILLMTIQKEQGGRCEKERH